MTPLWARLDVRAIVVLAEVVRSGSFTAAAAALGTSQSAVSQQVARLERTVGHRLLDRSAGGRTVSLTAAGRILTDHVDDIVAGLQGIANDIEELRQGTAGVLRVGAFESVGIGLLPAALTLFAASYPRVRVELVELPDDGELLAQVRTGALDLTFVVFPLVEGPFEARALVHDPYVLVTAADADSPPPGPVDLERHPDLRLMVYAELRAVHSVEARLGRPSYGERVVFRSNHNSTLIGLAGQGYAAAVLPALGVPTDRSDLRVHPLPAVGPRTVGIAWHRHRPLRGAAATFVECAREAAGQAGQAGPGGQAG